VNWRRGLFRLWIVGTALFVIAVAAISYSGIKAEFDALAIKPEAGTPSHLAEVREQYPEYRGLSDDQLVEAMYKRFYSDMPREQFNKRLTEKTAASRKIINFRGQQHSFPADFTDEEIATALKSTLKNPWASVGMVAGIAL
jgi:hypothetical protein